MAKSVQTTELSEAVAERFWALVRRTLVEVCGGESGAAASLRDLLTGASPTEQQLFYHAEPLDVAFDLAGGRPTAEQIQTYLRLKAPQPLGLSATGTVAKSTVRQDALYRWETAVPRLAPSEVALAAELFPLTTQLADRISMWYGIDQDELASEVHAQLLGLRRRPPWEGQGPSRTTLNAFVREVARTMASRERRRAQREESLREDAELVGDTGQEAELEIERVEAQAIIAEALATLPESDQELLRLVYYEGLSMREAGEALGMSGLRRVYKRRAEALDAVRTFLAARGIQEGDI